MSLLQTLPATERALRDTLVAKAPSTAFDTLAGMYQFPRPSNIDTEAWRQALRQVLWARRGARATTHAFLEKAWSKWSTTFVCNVTNNAPQTLTWVSGGSAGGFTKSDVHRLFRVGANLYWSTGPAFNAGPAVSATLTLCPVGTAYWQAAKFLAPAIAVAVRLPFVWSDFDAKFILAADVDTTTVPPTYMQPGVRWQAAAAGGLQGNQNTFYGSDSIDLPQWQDPAPPVQTPGYVVTAATAGTWRNLFFNADHDPNNPNSVPARGGTYDITLLKLTNGVWGPTALTCTLAADSKTAFDTTHTVALVAGDVVSLYIAANNGVNQPVVFPKASIYIDPPNGEPPGGYIMPNGAVNPSTADAAAGLAPLYLNGGLDEALLLSVRRLLAAGVIVESQIADFVSPDGYW